MKIKSKSRTPFIVGIGIVSAYTIIRQLLLDQRNGMIAMNDFMGIRFLLFGALKLLDLKGFVKGFRKYDTLAKLFPLYGRLFAFIEIGLGLAYLLDYQMDYRIPINIITVLITGITSIGILITLKKRHKIDCLCMGTAFPLPMSIANLIENIIMGAMAVFMIFWMVFFVQSNHIGHSNTTSQTQEICH